MSRRAIFAVLLVLPASLGSASASGIAVGPDDAPVKIVEFADFRCPFCAKMAEPVERLIEAYPGVLQVEFRQFPLAMHPDAAPAHRAALAAAEQGRYREMRRALYTHRGPMDEPSLIRLAVDLGLQVDRFRTALEDRSLGERLAADMAEGESLGVTGTPTLFVNGVQFTGYRSFEELSRLVEKAAGFETPDPVASPAGSQLTPVRGSPLAPRELVLFSDLRCPFCANANGAVQQLVNQYRGKVRVAFRHFPLDIHPDAKLGHVAALAAGRQGRFWEFQDAVFSSTEEMTEAFLMQLAGSLGLDQDRFEADLDDTVLRNQVESDLALGRALGISGTPTFVIDGELEVGIRTAAELATRLGLDAEDAAPRAAR
jgi:protein-disulfide isomerase